MPFGKNMVEWVVQKMSIKEKLQKKEQEGAEAFPERAPPNVED